ncbi:hypothetical protein [Nostoc sp.]|uniref:hypothetical protein n=1 Tax=Nostoc sp. TaxID=1180 RepID=UPI002FF9DFB0
MTYFQQLHPWCIIRVLSNEQVSDNAGVNYGVQQSNVIARFRHRDDAVAYLQVLQHHSIKNINFLIIFDIKECEIFPIMKL